jgi:hypothetical protein
LKKAVIIGDSFTQHYTDTYLEYIVMGCELTLVQHKGFPGQSQYRIYQAFREGLQKNPDVMILVHTEYSRLYHPAQALNPHLEHLTMSETADPDIISAAKQYYQHIYDDEYHRSMYQLMLTDMQNKCRERGIKMINMPAFNSEFIDKFYGLWFVSDVGLTSLSRADFPSWDSAVPDQRRNHFTEKGHDILAQNTLPHIVTYLGSDEPFHLHIISPVYFS